MIVYRRGEKEKRQARLLTLASPSVVLKGVRVGGAGLEEELANWAILVTWSTEGSKN